MPRLVFSAALLSTLCSLSAVPPAFAQPRGSTASTTPSGGLAEAEKLVLATDYTKADVALRAVGGNDQPRAQLLLARTLIDRGRYAEADAALRLAEAGPRPLQVLAKVEQARSLRARGELAKATALLRPMAKETSPEGRALRLALGELLLRQGKRAEAEPFLHAVVDDYETMAESDAEGLAQVGRAAHLLRSPKDANRAYQESERAQKGRVELLLWRAELFFEKYDPGHAEEAILEALQIAPNLAAAHVALARVKLEQSMDFGSADAELDKALAINPEISSAYEVRAGMAIRDGDLDKAGKQAALAVAKDRFNLEAKAVQAAVRLLDEDKAGYTAKKSEVLAQNREYANFFVIVADFADWEHRYDDIVAMMQEARGIDPDDGRVLGTLGLTLLRVGDEKGALEVLNRAWSKDKFNVRVYNTLNLYEKNVATGYESLTAGPFQFRFPKDESAMLARYVPAFAGQAWASMKARYGFVPDVPMHIELYANREHFSVRTSGLPNIGIQGVCFGRVVAALSPESEPFNWGNVLWHELGHVFAIKESNFRVPRWFTEGLSEYETIVRRPEWQRELDQELYRALKRDALPSAVNMNRAFTHAKSGMDMTVAYYASSQLLVFTVERFGMDKVRRALALWGEGKKTPEVLRGAFGVAPEAYDAEFRAWARKRLARYEGQYLFSEPQLSLDEAKAKTAAAGAKADDFAALAVAHLRAKQVPAAQKALERALALDATNKDALYVHSRLALGEKNDKAFQTWSTRLRDAGGDGYALRMLRAEAAVQGKREADYQESLLAAHRFDPSQPEPIDGLVKLARKRKDTKAERELLEKLYVLEQHDRDVARRLLELLVEAKDWAKVIAVGESALFTDVHSAAVHLALGRALAASNQTDRASFELESATLGRGKPAEIAEAHAQLALLWDAKGDKAKAKAARDRALSLDGGNATAKGLSL